MSLMLFDEYVAVRRMSECYKDQWGQYFVSMPAVFIVTELVRSKRPSIRVHSRIRRIPSLLKLFVYP